MTFGDWLRKTREENRMSGVELSRRSGVSRQYISNLERNVVTEVTQSLIKPSEDKVVALAKGLGVGVDEALLAAGYAPDVPEEILAIDWGAVSADALDRIVAFVEFTVGRQEEIREAAELRIVELEMERATDEIAPSSVSEFRAKKQGGKMVRNFT